MGGRLTISLDGMGGDHSPQMVVDGAALAARMLQQVDFLLFGDEEKLKPLVARHPHLQAVTTIRHAPEIVTNEMRAATALRSARNSSMRLAINAVAKGEAQGIVSAGNTGALMALAKFVLKTLPGIDRPAIATYFPTERGASVMLDLGANVECDANNLVQFAIMGEVFGRNVLGLDVPSVGLLNVGVEGLKGSDSVKKADAILRASSLPIRYQGFIEGNDIAAGTVDVVVTDGFSGNIALKVIEGTAKFFAHLIRSALTGSTRAKLGALLAKPALDELKHHTDPRRYNGAMFVGLNGICVKSHGGTDAYGFSNAIRVAVEMITHDFKETIDEDLKCLAVQAPESQTRAVAGK